MYREWGFRVVKVCTLPRAVAGRDEGGGCSLPSSTVSTLDTDSLSHSYIHT